MQCFSFAFAGNCGAQWFSAVILKHWRTSRKMEKTPPTYQIGQRVEVVLNEGNRTYHKGIVISRIWHHKEAKWFYTIRANGRKVIKRYDNEDLRVIED
jgi:hypothetical protein